MSFETHLPAKCILSGEYTILKKGFAIVCPFEKYELSLSYTPGDIKTVRTISGEGFDSMLIILWSVVTQALEYLGEKPNELTGTFKIKCSIPPCSGLGFSAALCVSIAEWAIYCGYISKENLFDFALKLEDNFHLKSSGVDVAGVMSKKVIMYSATREITNLALAWHPYLYISSSGEQSITKHCMERINELNKTEPERVTNAEEKMRVASIKTKEALESDNNNRLALLSEAINMGNECYYEWDLVCKSSMTISIS